MRLKYSDKGLTVTEKMEFNVIFLFLSCMVSVVVGSDLRCYACSFNSVDTDQSCLTVTDDTRVVECTSTYCTILRQEFVDPSGVVASFVRGCEEEPDYLNHEVVDSHYKTYYRACTTSYCNDGNGIESVGGGSLSPTPEYSGLNLLVPGTGNALNLKISLVILFVGIFVNIILS